MTVLIFAGSFHPDSAISAAAPMLSVSDTILTPTPTPDAENAAAVATSAAEIGAVLGGGAKDPTATAEIPSTAVTIDPDTPCTQLQDYDQSWQDAVAELEHCGYIGSGGSLINFPGDAGRDGYINLALDVKVNGHYDLNWGGEITGTDKPDVVMAGTIKLHLKKSTLPDDMCGLTVRARGIEPGDISGGYLQTFLEVDLAADGRTRYRESSKGDENYAWYDEHLDMKQTHHVIMIAIDDRFTFFVDGKLIAQDLPVENRRGTYRAGMYSSDTRAAACDVQKIWVYAAPSAAPGVCQVASSGMINRRKKPGTSSKKLNPLYKGDFPVVIGQTQGKDAHTWYQLEDHSWVRDDIVTLLGDCENIPAQ